MTISTYSELQTSVANWSGSGAFAALGAHASRVDEIIDNAEAMINNDLRSLEMETTNPAFPVNAEYVPLPANFGGVRSFKLNGNVRKNLSFMPDDSQNSQYNSGVGEPHYFCVTGNNFRFAPVPDSSYSATLVYFLKVPSLNSTTTTNWLLTSHPHIYLAATQFWSYVFLKDGAAAQAAKALYDGLMQDLKRQDRSARWGGNGMAVRLG